MEFFSSLVHGQTVLNT